MPDREKISKRNAQIECIELDEKYFKGNQNRFQKIKRVFRINMRPRK